MQYSLLICVNVGILDRAHGKTGESANSANSQPSRPSSQHGSVVSPEPSTPSTNATGMRTKIHVCFYFEIPFYWELCDLVFQCCLILDFRFTQRRIEDPVKHLWWSLGENRLQQKNLHLRCLTWFWIHLCPPNDKKF